MKQFTIFLSFFLLSASLVLAQAPEKSKVGWFISPEVGGILHSDHLGNTVGASFGVKLWQNRLKVGILGYGRSGPINPQEFTVETSTGESYRGSNVLRLRADHGAFGLMIAPSFSLRKIHMDIPIVLGQLGAGFYLLGEDRNTPDGRRVSEWENQLMDGRDAGFANMLEVGVRAFVPLSNEHISLGAGLHYTMAPGWETYYDPSGDFYNNRLRFSLIVNFESGN